MLSLISDCDSLNSSIMDVHELMALEEKLFDSISNDLCNIVLDNLLDFYINDEFSFEVDASVSKSDDEFSLNVKMFYFLKDITTNVYTVHSCVFYYITIPYSVYFGTFRLVKMFYFLKDITLMSTFFILVYLIILLFRI